MVRGLLDSASAINGDDDNAETEPESRVKIFADFPLLLHCTFWLLFVPDVLCLEKDWR